MSLYHECGVNKCIKQILRREGGLTINIYYTHVVTPICMICCRMPRACGVVGQVHNK